MKILVLIALTLTLGHQALAGAASAASDPNQDCAAVEHPENNDTDYSATDRLIKKQKSCAEAEAVFNRCPHGAMYANYEGSSVLDQSASVIEICEKSVSRHAGIKRAYTALVKKYCSFKGESRHTVAITDECNHNLAVSFGTLEELRRDQ